MEKYPLKRGSLSVPTQSPASYQSVNKKVNTSSVLVCYFRKSAHMPPFIYCLSMVVGYNKQQTMNFFHTLYDIIISVGIKHVTTVNTLFYFVGHFCI